MKTKIYIFLLIITLCFGSTLYAQNTDTLINSHTKIGLVLSGGGARGFAHIGVLKILEEQGIRPDYITGTSMGSLVGALYSLGYSANQLENIVKDINWDELLSDNVPFRDVSIFKKDNYPGYSIKMNFNYGIIPQLPSGMIAGQKVQNLFAKLVWKSNRYQNFDSFPIPFRCVATDIIQGRSIVFKDGNLAEAMRASMAIPTIFSPIEKDSLLLVDGGVLNNYPVQECLNMGADIVIGVYTGFVNKPDRKELKSMVKILVRSAASQSIQLSKIETRKTYVNIDPVFGNYGPEDFNYAQKIIQLGENAGRDSLIINKLQTIASQINSSKLGFSKDDTSKIWIDKVFIHGCKQTDSIVLRKISNFKNNMFLSSEEIFLAIEKLYSSTEFEKITYTIERNNNKRILNINIVEKTRASLELGVHFDNSYGIGALFKLKYKNLLLKSTESIFKFSISRNPQALLSYKYYPTKGKKIELSLNVYSQLTKMPDIIKEKNLHFTLGHYVYTRSDLDFTIAYSPFKNFSLATSVIKQFDNIALKEGMEIYYNTKTVNYNYSLANVQIRLNTLNDPYFATNGIIINTGYKYCFGLKSNQSDTTLLSHNNTNENMYFTFDYKQFILIGKRFSLVPEFHLGAIRDNTFITNKFFIGGNNYSLRPNSYNYGGIKANYIAADIFSILGFGLQYKIKNNWYLQLSAQDLLITDNTDYIIENEDSETILEDNYFTNVQFGVGYQSRLGPIRLILSKSPERKDFVWSLNIGIPF